MTDLDYTILDPGIRGAVQYLRERGFETADSGDGESKPPEERDRDVAHVAIVTTGSALVEECKRLVRVLEELHIETKPVHAPTPMLPRDVAIYGTYDPVSDPEQKRGLIVVMGAGLLNISPPPSERTFLFLVVDDGVRHFVAARDENDARRVCVEANGEDVDSKDGVAWLADVSISIVAENQVITSFTEDARTAEQWAAAIGRGVLE